MARINWKKKREEIPPHVQIGKKLVEVVWIKDFKDGQTLGETRFDEHTTAPKQIVLRMEETAKETVHTYLHEIAHAVSAEEDMGLTESQVRKFENSLKYLLKDENIFRSKK